MPKVSRKKDKRRKRSKKNKKEEFTITFPKPRVYQRLAKKQMGEEQYKEFSKGLRRIARDLKRHFKTDKHDIDFSFYKDDVICSMLGGTAWESLIISTICSQNDVILTTKGEMGRLVFRLPEETKNGKRKA